MRKNSVVGPFAISIVTVVLLAFLAEASAQTPFSSTGIQPAIWNELPHEEFRYEITETSTGQIVGAQWLRIGVWYREDTHLLAASEQMDYRRRALFGNFSPLAELQYLERSYDENTGHYGLEGAYRLYVDLATGEPLIGSFAADGRLIEYVPITRTVTQESLRSVQTPQSSGGGYAPLPAGTAGDF